MDKEKEDEENQETAPNEEVSTDIRQEEDTESQETKMEDGETVTERKLTLPIGSSFDLEEGEEEQKEDSNISLTLPIETTSQGLVEDENANYPIETSLPELSQEERKILVNNRLIELGGIGRQMVENERAAAAIESENNKFSLPIESSMALDSQDSNHSFLRQEPNKYLQDSPIKRDEVSRASFESENHNIPRDETTRMSYESIDHAKRFAELDDSSNPENPDYQSGSQQHQPDPTKVIWGTKVNADVSKLFFKMFLKNFTLPEELDPHYIQVLDNIRDTREYNLNINCKHFEDFTKENVDKGIPDLYKLCVRYPQEMIPLMDLVVHEEYCERHPDDNLDELGVRIQVRLYNLQICKKMRDLDPTDIDQLVMIEGMIIRASPVVPDMKQGFFRCNACHFTLEVPLDRGRIAEPRKCTNCGTTGAYNLVHNRCLFADKQCIKLQESSENVTEGETPHTCTVLAYDSLVDVCKPGDRVRLTGVLRATAVRVDPRKRTIRAVYKTHLDVLHVSWKQQGRMRAVAMDDDDASKVQTFQEADGVLTASEREADREMFREMSQSPTLYEDLAQSLAPSIWELKDVKKGLLLQMLGGTTKRMSDEQVILETGSKTAKTRSEINILLCGDPGTSKSQLLSYVHRVAPRGIYTSGKGSSAVGLTAYITKDPDSKELVLESGALVLSDRGVCCIDEFDKMSDATRAILHEVMEQQTISLAKAGIICTLNARTSILASANPVGSRYDPKTSVVENLKLPPTLLSRFDLIYLILDRADAESDRRLAKHLVQLFTIKSSISSNAGAKYSLETLAKYIAYAREESHPIINDEAKRKLVDAYIEMRRLGNMGGGGKKTIVATPRQLESFVRMAEAKAKLRLSDEVTVDDVEEAVRLFNVATHKAAMDPRTGTIDMDAINTGVSSVDRLAEKSFLDFLKGYILEKYSSGDFVYTKSLLETLNARENVPKVEKNELQKAFDVLNREQFVLVTSGGVRIL